jgi:hypothetical protein
MNTKRLRRRALSVTGLLLTSALLTACFGGGDDEDPAPVPTPVETDVPASAAASPDAYSRYTATLPASETAEPLGLDKFSDAPGSETAEPADLG